jgi:hypothetical protein
VLEFGARHRARRDKEAAVIRKILIVAYFVVGLIVASSHHFFSHLDGFKPVLSALLAIVLWPLVLFGVNLHIK